MIFLKLCYTTSVGHRQSSLLILLALGKRRDRGREAKQSSPFISPLLPQSLLSNLSNILDNRE